MTLTARNPLAFLAKKQAAPSVVEVVLDDGAKLLAAAERVVSDPFIDKVGALRELMKLAYELELVVVYERIWELHRSQVELVEYRFN